LSPHAALVSLLHETLGGQAGGRENCAHGVGIEETGALGFEMK